jgi:hypothetical protein
MKEDKQQYALGFIEGSLPTLYSNVRKLAVLAKHEAEETSVAAATEAKRKGKPALLESYREELMALAEGVERLMCVLALPHEPIPRVVGQGQAPTSTPGSEPLT